MDVSSTGELAPLRFASFPTKPRYTLAYSLIMMRDHEQTVYQG